MPDDLWLVDMDSVHSFRIGDWLVEPELDRISCNGEATSVRPQVMELLIYLARRPGEVLSADQLTGELWPGKVVTNASLYNCVAELRRALGASRDQPSPIVTIPKRGYRLVGEVSGLEPIHVEAGGRESPGPPAKKRPIAWSLSSVLAVLAAAYFAIDHSSNGVTSLPLQRDDSGPFIAVLPFKDLSPAGNQAYFSDGITEELINSLAQISDLRVASRSTSFALSDAGPEGGRMTDRLDLTHLLEGSVRKDGDRVRITAQLIDARSDTHLWSSSYDRKLDNAFAIQREISAQVVKELKIRIVKPARALTSPDPKALELVLEGRYLVSGRQPGGLKRAESLFAQATEIDPDYADAYAGLAKSLVLTEGLYQWGDSQLVARARTALDRALTLDPRNSDALASSGLMLWGTDSEAAQGFYERAIDSNPSNSDAYRWLALSYEQTEPLRYLESIRKAYLVDPLNHPLNFHRAVSLSRLGRFEEAFAAVRDWLRLNPRAPGPHVMAGRIHFWQGDFDEALRSYYRAYRINPDWRAPAIHISELFTELNYLELAEAWLRLGPGERSSGNEGRTDMVQRILLADLRGQEKLVSTLLSRAQEPNPDWSLDLGRVIALVTKDFGPARAAWERGVTELGWSELQSWGAPNLIDYALVLQRTGEQEKALDFIDVAKSLMEKQLAAGMIHYGEWETFQTGTQFYSAALHALTGDKQHCMAALLEGSPKAGLMCMRCLRTWPHFDSLRGDPDFQGLLVQVDAERAVQRQRLSDRGMLLSPEEVSALGDLNFGSSRLAAQFLE